MPELPEVETTRRGIAPHITHQRIRGVLVREPRLRWPVPDALGQLATGREILEVTRRAKYLFLRLETGTIIIHLGMSGSLRVVDRLAPLKTHDHVDIELENGKVLRYHDPRRFGSILWAQDPLAHALIQGLGPEPLEAAFDGKYLFEMSRKKKVAVKNFLMDSHIVVGVGNIYANESLFLAGIQPEKPASAVSLARYKVLVARVKEVLSDAIASGGTTLRDFVHEDGSPGYFKQSLRVYGRGGLPCVKCQKELKEIRLGQRTTVYCSRCQRS